MQVGRRVTQVRAACLSELRQRRGHASVPLGAYPKARAKAERKVGRPSSLMPKQALNGQQHLRRPGLICRLDRMPPRDAPAARVFEPIEHEHDASW
jgi:hypothetical protein